MKKMGFAGIEGGDREKDYTSDYYSNSNNNGSSSSSKGTSPLKIDEHSALSLTTNGHSHSSFYAKSLIVNKNSEKGLLPVNMPSLSHVSSAYENSAVNSIMASNNSFGSRGQNVASLYPGTAVVNNNNFMNHPRHTPPPSTKSSTTVNLTVPTSLPQNIPTDLRHSRSPNALSVMDHSPVPSPSIPANESELQLYRVLQRANLLQYFSVMIELGGDDVQQLCEAGEEEFLEIMALIGMASKPLHVRRLQKTLQEWMTQPQLFQAMYFQPGALPFNKLSLPSGATSAPLGPRSYELTEPQAQLHKYILSQANQASNTTNSNNNNKSQNKIPIRPIAYHSSATRAPKSPHTMTYDPADQKNFPTKYQYNPGGGGYHSSSNSNSPTGNLPNAPNNSSHHLKVPGGNIAGSFVGTSPNHIHSSSSSSSSHSSSNLQIPSITIQQAFCNKEDGGDKDRDEDSFRISVDQIIPSHFLEQKIRTRSEPNSPAPSLSPHPDSRCSLSPVPFLQDVEVQKLVDAAIKLVRTLPQAIAEPRMSARKKSCEDFEAVVRLPEKDPKKMDEIRKCASIYGRYDCKRKLQKPLTLHELSVNEAAAQLCKHIPALLTRRDELFPLARQVVRDAGLPYGTSTNLSISLIPSSGLHVNKGNQDESSGFNGLSKRLRLDVRGIEIHEYNRPTSNTQDDSRVCLSPDDPLQVSNSSKSPAQITSNSNNHLQIISPHDRVTITSVRKKSILSSFHNTENSSETEGHNLSTNAMRSLGSSNSSSNGNSSNVNADKITTNGNSSVSVEKITLPSTNDSSVSSVPVVKIEPAVS